MAVGRREKDRREPPALLGALLGRPPAATGPSVFPLNRRGACYEPAVSNGTHGIVSDDLILQTEDLTKEFAGFLAVNGVNLRIKRGSIHALIGPNGAGKTTCFNLLTKFLRPTRGRIAYKGRDITAVAPADVARLGLVRSFQISAVFPHLTVLENVRVALQRRRGGSFDFWRSKRVLDGFNDRAMALIGDVGLATFAQATAVELPYGRKRALEIATTLALDPEMLLLDEPTAGMGHEDIDRISALIKSVSATRTVLMVEHNLSVVANLSDRITVLTRGRVLAEGDYQTVSADPSVREAYLGVGHA
jgi:branched-chain amino acid transport system ATP-binding protein